MDANDKKLVLAAIEMDDIGTLLGAAGSMAVKYGPGIIDYVKGLWAKSRDSKDMKFTVKSEIPC